MKKAFSIIVYPSVILSLILKTLWIVISNRYETQQESAQQFLNIVPPYMQWIAGILAVFSIFVFAGRLRTEKSASRKSLVMLCLIIQSIYVFLEVFQLV